jgi:acetoin utilization protein AcuB
MSREVITVYPDTGVIDAKVILDDYQICRLPVVDEQGNLVGIVTLSDIRRACPCPARSLSEWQLNYHLPALKVKDIMTVNPVTVYTTDSVATAVILMLEHTISGLPVLAPADRKLVGIITESDVFDVAVQFQAEIWD